MSDRPLRVRFAPSPTGYLHIGGARTALFNWLLARKHGGTFILRMEDTDQERNTDAARETIFRGLDWLGLTPDEGPEQGGDHGPYSQSERQDLYTEYARKLIEADAVYPCFCSRERLAELRASQEAAKQDLRYDGSCRALDPGEARRRAETEEHTWRLKVPEGETTVVPDLIRGDVTVDNRDIEDIILIRANGAPVYNFVVVVDDRLMEVTHVIRGEDHLTNTFKQVLVYQALGWEVPIFAHLPLILGPTGQGKLSKRKHPEAALEHYQDAGYPVEAFVNWLALIGWSYDDKTTVMSRDELVERFSLERVGASAARLPMDKLEWISGEYIREMPDDEVAAEILPFLQKAGWMDDPATEEQRRQLAIITECSKDRLRRFSDVTELVGWAFTPITEREPKAEKNLGKDGALDVLRGYRDVLLGGDFADPTALEADARAWCESAEVGFGKLVHPVRAALTGRTQGPGLFHCAAILGAEECARRIDAVLS